AQLDPTGAQLVQRAQVLGQVDGAVQRGDKDDAAQAYPLGASRRVTQRLKRTHERHRAERLLERPGALEAERLRPRHVRPEASRIELTIGNELRDGDRKPHVLAPVSSAQTDRRVCPDPPPDSTQAVPPGTGGEAPPAADGRPRGSNAPGRGKLWEPRPSIYRGALAV